MKNRLNWKKGEIEKLTTLKIGPKFEKSTKLKKSTKNQKVDKSTKLKIDKTWKINFTGNYTKIERLTKNRQKLKIGAKIEKST